MATIQDGVFLNKLNVDRVFETVARIESERLGVRIRYAGKRLKEGETKNEAGQEIKADKSGGGIRNPASQTKERRGTRGVSAGSRGHGL